MKYYFAPLEGITGYIYRSAHASCFPGMGRYYSPFLVPHQNRDFDTREKNDILPEHNQGYTLIPQILTNRSEDFLRLSAALARYGYREINLNLGCPSGTVVTRGKGSGFLTNPDALDRFLSEVCSGFEHLHLKLSVKTRIGWESAEEWPRASGDAGSRLPGARRGSCGNGTAGKLPRTAAGRILCINLRRAKCTI